MEIGYRIDTKIMPDGKIVQELSEVMDDMKQTLLRSVMDTKEQQTREALIRLGWTPPQENPDAK